jgi:hypothetical protein
VQAGSTTVAARARAGRRAGRLSAFVLAGFLGACGGGGGDAASPAAAQGGGGAEAASSGPSALVGTWGFAAASGNYCNPLGQCTPGSGGSESFRFTAQGDAEYALFDSALIPACGEVKTLTHVQGRVSVVGSSLVFTPVWGTYTASNACRPDLSGIWSLESADLAPMTMEWQLVPDAVNPVQEALTINDPAGKASGTYSRRAS